MSDPLFSLIIPCYNESKSLPELVARSRFVAEQGGGEVILVDNGSSDGTPAVLEELLRTETRVRSVRVEVNQGYGFGILTGLAASTARYIGWTHADLQTDPADVLRILPIFAENPGRVFVKGRRYGRPLGDRVFTNGMSLFESVLLRTRLSDINAQPTLFSRELFDGWTNPPHDFALDLYAIYSARKSGFRIFRVPVIFAPRRFGSSSWNIDWKSKQKFIRRTIDFSLALKRTTLKQTDGS